MADSTQARAVRRMGELLKEFDAQGKRTDKLVEGDYNKLTMKEAAETAGISHRSQTAPPRRIGGCSSGRPLMASQETPADARALPGLLRGVSGELRRRAIERRQQLGEVALMAKRTLERGAGEDDAVV
jgi:hypothetical protein